MTCIVGLVEGDAVVIGGDSAGVAGSRIDTHGEPKVFRNGPYAIGYTTSFRMGQLLEYDELPRPGKYDADDLRCFMVTKFVPHIRALFSKAGFLAKDKEREEGGTFLIGIAGHLFVIDSDFQVGTRARGYAAVGSGSSVALGALYSTVEQFGYRLDLPATEKVVRALSASAEFISSVRGPFNVVRTP